MQKLRVFLKQPGYESFNGHMRGHVFENGVSVDEIPARDAVKIGAGIYAEDENGVQISPTTFLFERTLNNTSAPILTDSVETTQVNPGEITNPEVTLSAGQSQVAAQDFTELTRADLEGIADAQGINGLREIGEKFGVKGKAVSEMIDKILAAQASLKAVVAPAPVVE
jgi:hypothetical protein